MAAGREINLFGAWAPQLPFFGSGRAFNTERTVSDDVLRYLHNRTIKFKGGCFLDWVKYREKYSWSNLLKRA